MAIINIKTPASASSTEPQRDDAGTVIAPELAPGMGRTIGVDTGVNAASWATAAREPDAMGTTEAPRRCVSEMGARIPRELHEIHPRFGSAVPAP